MAIKRMRHRRGSNILPSCRSWAALSRCARARQVKELVEKDLMINVCNMCTFLPQGKVGEFSGFDEKQLLQETERALGGEELLNRHKELIKLEVRPLPTDDHFDRADGHFSRAGGAA